MTFLKKFFFEESYALGVRGGGGGGGGGGGRELDL